MLSRHTSNRGTVLDDHAAAVSLRRESLPVTPAPQPTRGCPCSGNHRQPPSVFYITDGPTQCASEPIPAKPAPPVSVTQVQQACKQQATVAIPILQSLDASNQNPASFWVDYRLISEVQCWFDPSSPPHKLRSLAVPCLLNASAAINVPACETACRHRHPSP
ncbi:hypothetical protein ACJRO7_030897 [Eucalyptus globulus]|uniref:Uncharacterized protein n=1 Tax=Eucalyptus globulus TaxID=34317 RepID=A0ABD3JF48_EUCGL